MRLPKLRELREAVTAVLSPRFTTRFPAEPCTVPERYRGKPEFDPDTCVGCGACVNVCPTNALTLVDRHDGDDAVRRITLRTDTCIFCGNCQDCCTTETGIRLSREWDLAGLDRESMSDTQEYELALCERCGAPVGTKKHLSWVYDRLGPLAYTNPSLLLVKNAELFAEPANESMAATEDLRTSDFGRVICPKCRYELNVKL